VLIPLKSYLKEWLGAAAGLLRSTSSSRPHIMIISAFEPRGLWGIVEKIRRKRS
jgi:branched-chain amino acid transport system permease protein